MLRTITCSEANNQTSYCALICWTIYLSSGGGNNDPFLLNDVCVFHDPQGFRGIGRLTFGCCSLDLYSILNQIKYNTIQQRDLLDMSFKAMQIYTCFASLMMLTIIIGGIVIFFFNTMRVSLSHVANCSFHLMMSILSFLHLMTLLI